MPMKMEQSVPKRRHIKIQTPGNYLEESMQPYEIEVQYLKYE